MPRSSQLHSLWAALVVGGLLLGGCGEGAEPGTQTAGDSIATSAPSTDVLIAPLDTSGGQVRLGTIKPVTQRAGYDNQPAFTLDGGSVVWTSIRGDQSDVYRRPVGEGQAATRQLTDTPESEYSPEPRPNDRLTVVRVEADGRQRLWRYSIQGAPLKPVLPDADSVGYYAWLDANRVALFVLGSPPTLHLANPTAGTDTVIASRIGASLQPVPGRSAVSFVRVHQDSTTAIHLLEHSDGALQTRRLTGTPGSGTGDSHAWTPGGALLMATADTLWAWRPSRNEWRSAASLDGFDVSRLAVASTAEWVALVDVQ